jgi:DNA-binding NtrC family response regulator
MTGFFPQLAEFKRQLIRRELRRFKGNQQATADALRIHRNTLGRNCDELGIDPSAFYPRGKQAAPKRSRHFQKRCA